MKKHKFLISEPHKNILGMVFDNGAGEAAYTDTLKELVPNTTDAATEKHVPEVKVEGNKVTVTVGSVLHPMEEKHYIQWIYLQTKKGGQKKVLNPGDKPFAEFLLIDDEAVAVYEYCNLHGLWVKEL